MTYLVMDGRALHDVDRATVMDTIEADSPEEAIAIMAADWGGHGVVLVDDESNFVHHQPIE